MKIAHVVDSMETGGAEVLIAQLCAVQRTAGHEPSVHCLWRLGPLGERLRADGIPCYVTGQLSRPRVFLDLARTFRQLRPRVVHCHNATPTILGAPAAWLAGASSIVSTRHGLVQPPYGLSRELQFAFSSRFCGTVIAVSQATERNLRNAPLAPVSRIQTIYNGTNPPRPSDPETAPVKEGPTVVMVGRLAEPKDPATLLRAFSIINRRLPSCRLWFVGDGLLRPSAEALAQSLGLTSVVRFWGIRPDVGGFLSQADVFVLSSKSEGLPVSLIESMALGVPAVVSAVGGMPEVVEAAGAGSCVPPQDPERLAEAILAQLERNATDHPGAKLKEYYERHFTLASMANAYEELYRRFL